MPTPAVAVLLPQSERHPIVNELQANGFEPVTVADATELRELLARRNDVAVAIVDLDGPIDDAVDAWTTLQARNRNVPGLLVLSDASLDRVVEAGIGGVDDEFVTRPYSAESVRWRVEAMCIRSAAVDDGSGPVLQGEVGASDWAPRGALVAIFNPKGGVGKTTIATNLAAALVSRREKKVLLVDADTVTGHVTLSLGMDGAPTVVDAWLDELEGGPVLTLDQMASSHPSGLRVLSLTSSPIRTEVLEPQRVAGAITLARRGVDYVIVDLHPSYSPLNRAILDRADRILVPVTPDVPAIRATAQLRDVASELGMLDRLALIVNRANSGVPVADIEQAIGLPVFGEVRSGGLLVVRSINEGRPIVELAPREKIAQEFEQLADALIGVPQAQPEKATFRLFGRTATVGARA